LPAALIPVDFNNRIFYRAENLPPGKAKKKQVHFYDFSQQPVLKQQTRPAHFAPGGLLLLLWS